MYGQYRELTEEELARAVRLDPSQIAGLGPSLEMLRAMLEQRKQKILETYETRAVEKKARRAYEKSAKNLQVPREMEAAYKRAIVQQQPD